MSTPEELAAKIQAEEAQISQDITNLETLEGPQVLDVVVDDTDIAVNLTKSVLFPQNKE